MEIIESWEGMKILANKLPLDKSIRRFLIQGYLHEGHHNIINDYKQQCPNSIMIVQYQEMFPVIYQYLLFDNTNFVYNPTSYIKQQYYQMIKLSISYNENIDYLVMNTIPNVDKIWRILNRVKYDYLKYMIPFTKSNNINNTLAVESMFAHVVIDPIRLKLQEQNRSENLEIRGLKYLIHSLIHQKIFGHRYKEKPNNIKDTTVWKFFKNPDGSIKSRTGGATKLSFIRQKIVDGINSGIITRKELEEQVFNKYIIVDRQFTILDLNTIEMIDEINDNCVIIMMCLGGNDFIYIKDGELIY